MTGWARGVAVALALALTAGGAWAQADETSEPVALEIEGEGAVIPAEEPAPEVLTPEEQAHEALQQALVLEAQVEGLDQAIKGLAEAQEADRQAVDELGQRLDAEFQRIDPIALRVDALAEDLGQSDATTKAHDTQIRDNAGQIYDLLTRIDEVSETSEALSGRLQRQELRGRGAAVEIESASAPEIVELRLAFSVALTLLAPVGFALLAQSGIARTGAASTNSSIAAAWAGGVAGFVVLGVGLLTGPSVMGFVGNPLEALEGLFIATGFEDLALAEAFAQGTLAAIAALTICAALPTLVATSRRFLLALFVGLLLVPVAQHWIQAEADVPGWLATGGFLSSGASAVALVAGGCALMIRAQFSDEMYEIMPDDMDSPAGSLLLWGAWIGASLISDDRFDMALPVVLASILAAAGAIGALLLVAKASGIRSRWNSRLGLGALAGIIAGPGAIGAAPVALLFAGVLAALAFLLIRSLRYDGNPAMEAVAAIAAGGLVGVMAPGLVGEGGVLQTLAFDTLAIQGFSAMAMIGLALLFGALAAHLLLRASTTPLLPEPDAAGATSP